MKKQNTMLQTEYVQAPSSKCGKRIKYILLILLILTPLCVYASGSFLAAKINIDYNEIEGGIWTEEYNGYIIFKAMVPKGTSVAYYYESPETDKENKIDYTIDKIYLSALRYDWWFEEKQEKAIFIVSYDGRFTASYLPERELEKILDHEYKNEESNPADWIKVSRKLIYCNRNSKKETLLWRLNPDE